MEAVGEGRSGAEVRLEVRGEGFLRHMVRNLAGTLIEVGRGRWAPERVAGILASRDRAQAGPTAPAQGLVLVAVRDSWSERDLGRGPESGAGDPHGPAEPGVHDVDEGDPVG